MSVTSNGKSDSDARRRAAVRPSSILPALATKQSHPPKEASADSGKSSNTEDLIVYGTPMRSSSSQSEDRKTRSTRTNSLPGVINRRYSIETSTKHVQIIKKSGRRRGVETETKSAECVYQENLSLDLSRVSDDFADSEDETLRERPHRQKLTNQALSRRRRSIEKDKALLKSKQLTPSSAKSTFARRSSLQSFTPKGQAALNEDNHKTTCSSPDYTSEPSTCDTSPCKLSPNSSMLPSSDRTYKNSNRSNNNNMSASSSCYTSWMEQQPPRSADAKRDDDAIERGEWNNFWRDYNNSPANIPQKKFYDDCPTPFYEGPPAADVESLRLTRSDAEEMIRCAHRLAEVLTSALEKRTVNGTSTESKAVQVDLLRHGKQPEPRKILPLVLELNESYIKARRSSSVGGADNDQDVDTISHILLSGITLLPGGSSKDVQLRSEDLTTC